MGVIRNVTNLSDSYTDSIEDVLEEIQNAEQPQEPQVRKHRKIKHRSVRLHAIGDIQNTNAKSGKRKKRIENSNYLISLADLDESREISIQDFIPHRVSVFSQVLIQAEDFDFIWNSFLNCTENEDWFERNIDHCHKCDEPGTSKQLDAITDGRSDHPAYTAAECFKKIDGDLRSMLKKKHVPLGNLIYLENELVTFFMNRPQSIFHCQIPSSFERLMVHALSQYMDLSSLSYDRSGVRWTGVLNKKSDFQLPPALLSSILEKRQHRMLR